MGDFVGHAFPGIIFLLYGVWWTINIFRSYFASLGRDKVQYRSQPWYPGPFGNKFPFESAFKIATSAMGIALEFVIYWLEKDNTYVHNHLTHVTAYFFLSLHGAMDLLKYKGLPLPDGIEAASAMLSLGVAGFMFSSHLHDGRPLLDVKVHVMQVYTFYAFALSIFLEIHFCDFATAALARAFITLLIGTWLFQEGFIICPPFPGMRQWDLMDHGLAMLVPVIFAWHMAAIFVFMMTVGAAVWFRMKRGHQLDQIGYHLIALKGDGCNPKNLC